MERHKLGLFGTIRTDDNYMDLIINCHIINGDKRFSPRYVTLVGDEVSSFFIYAKCFFYATDMYNKMLPNGLLHYYYSYSIVRDMQEGVFSKKFKFSYISGKANITPYVIENGLEFNGSVISSKDEFDFYFSKFEEICNNYIK